MALPEKIREYVLIDWSARSVACVTHDARLMVSVRGIYQEKGIELDLVNAISSRRVPAVGQLETRCFGCPTPHTISVEATDDGSSRMVEGICETAAACYERDKREQGRETR
jgi:hypothetical protein